MLDRPWQYVAATRPPEPPVKRHHKSQKSSKSQSSQSRRQPRRPRTTIKSLPEEVLAQIFREVRKDDVFYDRRGRAHAISGRNSLLSTALVCKRFHWIVTPLLYERLDIHPGNEALIRSTLHEDQSLTKHVRHLRISMPKRFRTWAMKYQFSPRSFSLHSRYGIDLDILDNFRIDRHRLTRLFIGDVMNADLKLYIYLARTYPMLEDLTVESPLSFHSQWAGGSLEDTISCLLNLRRLTHLRLNCNFNPSRTTNKLPTKTWADLEEFLPMLPDRIQILSFGSLGYNEEFSSVSQSLIKCIATWKTSSSSHRHSEDRSGKRQESKRDSKHKSSSSTTKKPKRRWKIEMPDYLRERFQMLAKWKSPLRPNEIYIYR